MPPEIGMLVQTLVPEAQKVSPMAGMGPGSQVMSSVSVAPQLPPVSSVNPVAHVSSAPPPLPSPMTQSRHDQPPIPSGSFRSAPMAAPVSGVSQTVSGQHPSVMPRHSDARTPAVTRYAPPQNVGNRRLVFTIGVCVVVLLIVVLVVIVVQKL